MLGAVNPPYAPRPGAQSFRSKPPIPKAAETRARAQVSKGPTTTGSSGITGPVRASGFVGRGKENVALHGAMSPESCWRLPRAAAHKKEERRLLAPL